MCLIIYNQTGKKIPSHILDNAEDLNPDGFGITFLDTFETVRSMDYEEARILSATNRPFVAHYRYATVGSVKKKNCHPFPFKNEGVKYVLFSNGTVAGLGDKKKTDTQAVAEMLAEMPKQYWQSMLAMTETRFAIAGEDGEVITSGLWHEREGIYYSKANCFPERKSSLLCYWRKEWEEGDSFADETGLSWWNEREEWAEDWMDEPSLELPVGDLVAVYGTLKKGRPNHHILGDSFHIGNGFTSDRYLMASHGIPYVYADRIPGFPGANITVEVYKPRNAETWRRLDALEGHPVHYERKLISVEIGGECLNAWLYFAGHEPDLNDDFISEY